MHVVVADGSRTGLMILHRMLEARGDEIVLFMDGREALDYIRETPTVDLLLTSFELANLSGAELCWEARVLADAGRPLYVIAMSASEGQNAISVLDAGADDFMSKPPRQDELNARLRVAERTVLMQKRLIELATVDVLSGLLNRRAFLERSERARSGLGDGDPLSIILFDVDHFKRINDLHGHDAGDQVIRQIGRLRAPPDAVFGRVGGEEFAVVLANVPLDGAVSVAEHLRAQIAGAPIDIGEQTIAVTASFGVAVLQPGQTLHNLYCTADSALYHAKNSGRNRVACIGANLVA